MLGLRVTIGLGRRHIRQQRGSHRPLGIRIGFGSARLDGVPLEYARAVQGRGNRTAIGSDRDRRQIDLADHFADRNRVVVQQNCLAGTDPPAINKRPVLTAEVPNTQRVVIQEQNAMMTTDELALGAKMAILFASNQQLAAANRDCLTGMRSTENSQRGVHGAAPFC